MLTLRKSFPRTLFQVVRFNATVAPVSHSPQVPASIEVAQTQGRRRRKLHPKRPDPHKWNRPLGEGVVPAYDLALHFLYKDSKILKAELVTLRLQIAEKVKAYKALEERAHALPDADSVGIREALEDLDKELEELMKKADVVEVQSEVNLPFVRWAVNNAMADMSKVSHRHLVEQKWRKDGDLDLLMERLYQMHVVPDMLPEIHPSIDLHVITHTTPAKFLESKEVQSHIIPGAFLRPKQTLDPPKLYVKVFHTDVRLYTMLLVDLDVPQTESQRYTTFLHWMKPNIPLSATSSDLTNLNSHTTYIPPHPQRGTPYHRYVTLLLPQPPISKYSLSTAARVTGPTSRHLDIPVVPDEERHGFNVREFVGKWELNAASGGGAHMWREIWDKDVSEIYKNILKLDEPCYGLPPKFDAYAELKRRKKYSL